MKYCFFTVALILLSACSNSNKKHLDEGTIIVDTVKEKVIPSNEYKDPSIVINDSDTIQLDHFILYFSPAPLTIIPPIFNDSEIREEITDTIHNSHESAIAIENHLKKEYEDYFQADDSVLTLVMENSQLMKLKKWDAPKDFGNNFEMYYKKENYFLIFNQYEEGNGWTLINRKNGFKKYIEGEPRFSQEGSQIITINYDGYSANGVLQLLTVSSDTLISNFTLNIRNWAPTAVTWLSPTQIALEKRKVWHYIEKEDERKSYLYLTISAKE